MNRQTIPAAQPIRTVSDWSATISMAFVLAQSDIKMRYARSVLGPFWIALQMTIFVVGLGFVLSNLHGETLSSFLPFFAASFLFWSFFTSTIAEAQEAISAGGHFIRSRAFHPMIPTLQSYLRNLLIMAHTLIVPIVTLVLFDAFSIKGLLMAIPGMALFLINVLWIAICVAALGTRFRDIRRIVESGLLLVFIASPILWRPDAIAEHRRFIVDFNPLSHLFGAWRVPLFDERWALDSLLISGIISLVMLIFSLAAIKWMRRAAFWL